MFLKRASIFLVLGLFLGMILGYGFTPRVDTVAFEEEIAELEWQISVLNNTLRVDETEIAGLQAQVEEKSAAVSLLQGSLDERDGQISALETVVGERDAEVSTLQGDLDELRDIVPAYLMNEIDPADFVDGVDNPYFPLTPGATLVYEGVSEDGAVHSEDYVTFETRRVLGVDCVVVLNRVTVDGELIEETYDWYAQDVYGNVWYFGEESSEYDEGVVVGTEGSWEAGVDGALPGIIMEAEPREGGLYRQEYLRGEAEDLAEVMELGASISVDFGSYDDVLVIREWTLLEPGIVEYKYYAHGVGLVLERMVEGGSEFMELVDVVTAQA